MINFWRMKLMCVKFQHNGLIQGEGLIDIW